MHLLKGPFGYDNHAVDGPMRSDRHAVDDKEFRAKKQLEARDEGDVQVALRELCTKCCRMVENDAPRPAVNERPRVQILNAADAQRIERRVPHAQTRSDSRSGAVASDGSAGGM